MLPPFRHADGAGLPHRYPGKPLWLMEIGAISPIRSARKRTELPVTREISTGPRAGRRKPQMVLATPAPFLALLLAACGQIGAIDIPLGAGEAATAPPADFNTIPLTDPAAAGADPNAGLPPDPNAAPVVLDPLAAPNGLGEPGQAAAPAANADIAVAFNDLLGAWTVTINAGTCQLFLSGTVWENGYRGSTRDCPSDALATVSSWNLVDQQVVLYAAGNEITRLYAVSLVRNGDLVVNARFEGQMAAGGTPVAFFR
jgi:hypothetical protein